MTTQLEVMGNLDRYAVITFTAQAAGTLVSGDISIPGVRGVNAIMVQTSHTGTPSTTFSIQNKDPVTGQYFTVLTSAAVTADNTPSQLTVYPGAATTTNVSDGRPLSRVWRVSATVAGTTPAVTGSISVSLLV